MENVWQTSRRRISLDKTLVMGILNVTPDSFSDGGEFLSTDSAVRQAEKMLAEGADVLDIGGESTRPRGEPVETEEEIRRVAPVIEEIAKNFDVPISIDTSKAAVAEAALRLGAEIVNDISGLRFDEKLAKVAARHRAGLILMHSRGDFETMHDQPPVENILEEVCGGLSQSLAAARRYAVADRNIALDVGIGFGKTLKQNLELVAKLDRIIERFPKFPMLVGASRKSFIGKILGDAPPPERLQGSLASAAIAVWNGAKIVRVHDVKETVETLKVVEAIKKEASANER